MSLALCMLFGILLDVLLGELRVGHPLVLFGRCASALEGRFNAPQDQGMDGRAGRTQGLLAWCVLVLPPTVLVGLLSAVTGIGWWVDALCLYLALGLRSLTEHALPIARALRLGQLVEARQLVSRLVSRETAALDGSAVARAGTESVLENGSDAVFASLFWFAVAGAPGVVLHRLSNTLDAMWGYRNPRFRRFGWASARLDDLLNYVPARLTALSYGLCSGRGLLRALRCWRRQGRLWESPNAGPVMAAGAGALGVILGGPARYHGQLEAKRPVLGEGRPARAGDIERSVNLLWLAVGLWLLLILLGG